MDNEGPRLSGLTGVAHFSGRKPQSLNGIHGNHRTGTHIETLLDFCSRLRAQVVAGSLTMWSGEYRLVGLGVPSVAERACLAASNGPAFHSGKVPVYSRTCGGRRCLRTSS